MNLLWSQVEASIPLSDLPSFHRAFLNLHRPELEADQLPLRRVQQYVTQTLFTLVKEGKASKDGEDFRVGLELIPPQYQSMLGGSGS
jgi:hypothetical protein